MHVGANSGKLKVNWKIFGWVCPKWAWPFSSWDPNICCILRMSMKWDYFFACLHALKWGNHFWSVSLNASLLQLYLLDPRWLPEGPMKWSLSILLSFCLSDCFLGIGLLFFSEFWHGATNSYEVVRDIFGKTLFAPKIGKMGQR